MKAINIDWDIDYEEDRESLPTEIEIPADMEDEEVEDMIYCKVNVNRSDVCETLQYLFESITEMEIRFCEECGKPYDRGFTAENGDWYCCEECFESTMDRDYGRGNWRAAKEEGAYGGWYETLRDGRWEDTGIYWTDWN